MQPDELRTEPEFGTEAWACEAMRESILHYLKLPENTSIEELLDHLADVSQNSIDYVHLVIMMAAQGDVGLYGTELPGLRAYIPQRDGRLVHGRTFSETSKKALCYIWEH